MRMVTETEVKSAPMTKPSKKYMPLLEIFGLAGIASSKLFRVEMLFDRFEILS